MRGGRGSEKLRQQTYHGGRYETDSVIALQRRLLRTDRKNFFVLIQHSTSMPGQLSRFRCHRRRSDGAIEQGDVQFLLEFFDLGAHRRQGQSQSIYRHRERSQIIDFDKRTQRP